MSLSIAQSEGVDNEKELEIMILRYQLALAERKLQTPLKPSRVEKFALAVLLAG